MSSNALQLELATGRETSLVELCCGTVASFLAEEFSCRIVWDDRLIIIIDYSYAIVCISPVYIRQLEALLPGIYLCQFLVLVLKI